MVAARARRAHWHVVQRDEALALLLVRRAAQALLGEATAWQRQLAPQIGLLVRRTSAEPRRRGCALRRSLTLARFSRARALGSVLKSDYRKETVAREQFGSTLQARVGYGMLPLAPMIGGYGW